MRVQNSAEKGERVSRLQMAAADAAAVVAKARECKQLS
jgi:hypothetical protein